MKMTPSGTAARPRRRRRPSRYGTGGQKLTVKLPASVDNARTERDAARRRGAPVSQCAESATLAGKSRIAMALTQRDLANHIETVEDRSKLESAHWRQAWVTNETKKNSRER